MSTARADLRSTISADTTQFAAGMRRAGMLARNTGNAIGKGMAGASRSIANIGVTALKSSAAMATIGAGLAGAAASAALFKGVKLAADLESTAVAFETLTGSADTAKKVLEELRVLGAETPFEFPELADAGRKLIAFGEGADTVAETLRRVGDVSSAIQAPIGEIAELYGKARVQGRLFGEDINQLTGRGIPIIGMLAKQFGVAESEVKKLVENGKVGFGNLEQAFIDLTSSGGMFYGMMAKQSLTFNGQLSNLQDALGNLLTRFAAPINAALIPHLTRATEILSSMAPQMEAIANRFVSGFDMAKIAPIFSALSELLGVAVGEGFTKGLQIAGAILTAVFSKEGLSFIGDILLDIFVEAFNSIGGALYELGKTAAKAMKGEVDMKDTTRIIGTIRPEDEAPKTFADNMNAALAGLDLAPSDKMKDAAKTFTDTIGNLFPEAVTKGIDNANKGSESDLYDKELAEQRARIAADEKAMAGIASSPSPAYEPMGPPAALKMANAGEQGKRNLAMAGGFTGLAGLAQMQIDKRSGLGPGSTNVFAQDRDRLGLKSGLSGSSLQTGGLGDRRKVGQQKADGENKKSLTLAEKQAASLESIENKIAASLTVN